MPRGGTLAISSAMVSSAGIPGAFHEKVNAADYVCIRISDTGSGMDDKTKKALFEPFFTTRQEKGHRGLGLSTVYAIVTQSNGFIQIDTQEGRGTTVNLFFPAALATPAEKPVSKPAEVKTTHGTILLVEDEPGLRAILIKLLERSGYRVIDSGEPAGILSELLTNKPHIDLLLTDVIMPGMNGKQLSESLERAYPGLKVLFMSGYPADVLGAHGIIPDEIHFLSKPFTNQRLIEKIEELISGEKK